MDGQNHKITATSATAGHEGHGVHLCHKCGWPFPNPHPSAKNRRAHKRVCGTVEDYKIIHSDDHRAASDDDNASDDDELHTPSPNILKKNVGSSGREGEKSAKSEDDVFSDAVTDFSDSGISPRLEERFESMDVLGKSLEQKSVEGELHGSGTVEVEESADRTEKSKDARSEEISNHGHLANGNNQPDNVVLIADTAAKLVSVELSDASQPEHGVGGSVHSEHGSASASVSLDPEEGNVLDRTIAAGESLDAVHDPPPPSESLQTVDASEGINTVVHSSERSTSMEIVDVSLADETNESTDASVEVKEISHFTENIGSTESVGEDTSPVECLLSTSSVTPNNEHSDAACTVSSIDIEEIPKASLDGGQTAGNFDESEGEKSDITRNASLESKNLNSADVKSTADSTTDACEVDTTTVENTTNTALVTGNEKGEGASVEVELIPDSTTPSSKLTEYSSSFAADDGIDKSTQGHDVDMETKVAHSVGCAGAGSEVNHDTGDALDKNSLPTFSLEHTVSPVTSELQNNDHVAKDVVSPITSEPQNNDHVAKDVVEAASLDVSETPEHSTSKESASPLSDSMLLSRDTAKDDSCNREDANASESIVTTEATAEDHESNVVTREIPEVPTPNVQESSPEVELTHSSDDLSTSKSLDIIPSAGLTVNGKALTSDECSNPSVKQTVLSTSDVQDFLGTSDAVDDKSTKQTDDASGIDVSGSLTSRSDSLEANCGSVVSDTLETNSQKHKTTAEDAHLDKSDTFEPPSFMTLVQRGSEGEQVTSATEIEAVQNNQQPKSDALQAGWFPSLTNVVNESEGRKKNEEMIAKVTNWSPVKQQHGPLKSLLSEVKSPNTKQVPAANQKVEATTIDVTTASSVIATETQTAKDQDTNKHVEEWNSPARYPIEIKKEKRKGRPFWVPFVCCSSVAHRDL